MANGWFVIPMRRPATPDGRGTPDDPWRPKYLAEAGLGWNHSCNYRYWMLTEVEGTDQQLADLAAQTDVFAVPATGTLTQGQQNRLRNFLDRRGLMAVDTSLPMEQLIPAVIEAILAVQRAETDADRAAIFAELTA